MTAGRAALAAAMAAGALLALAVEVIAPLRALETRARDWLHAVAYPPTPLSERVAVIAFTEADVARMTYRSPLDRAVIADVVEAAVERGAVAIGLDLLFDQPTEPDKDARLRATLSRTEGPPVFVAVADEADGLSSAQAAWLRAYLSDARRAHVSLLRDLDTGVVRAVEGPRMIGGATVPPLSHALAAAAGANAPPGRLTVVHPRTTDPAGRIAPSFPAATAAALPPAWIEGRIVVIGADLSGVDRHLTPASASAGASTAGMLVHVAAVEQLLHGRTLVESGLAADAAAAAAAAALAAALTLGRRPRGRARLAALTAGGLLVAAAPVIAIAAAGVRGPALPPLGAYLIGAGGVAFARWRAEATLRAQLRDAFSRYVAPAVVDRIVAAPKALRLGGERREITCMFTDVEGFTGLCETVAPEPLCAALNRYLDGVSSLFVEHGATIDKFVGDAVVGFLGAPAADPDHAARAVALALAVDAFGRRFCEEARTDGLAFGVTRIGVHSGEAIVGNFGGARFFDYTAIGDTVNVAARLEAANKRFGSRVCISGATLSRARAARPALRARPVCEAVLPGRARPVALWMPMPTTEDAAERAADEAYREAYAAMATGDADAARRFEALYRSWPNDSLIRFHHNRLASGETGAHVAW